MRGEKRVATRPCNKYGEERRSAIDEVNARFRSGIIYLSCARDEQYAHMLFFLEFMQVFHAKAASETRKDKFCRETSWTVVKKFGYVSRLTVVVNGMSPFSG